MIVVFLQLLRLFEGPADGDVVGYEDAAILVDPVEHLFAVLLEQPQLVALVQLGLFHLPQLQQLLLARVDLVEQLHDMRDGGLHVRIEGHIARSGVSSRVTRVVAVSGFVRGKPEIKTTAVSCLFLRILSVRVL